LSFILAWAFCALFLFVRGKTAPQIHYQLVAVPAVYLLVAGLVNVRYVGHILLPLFALVMLVQTFTTVGALELVSQELVAGGMGTPLHYPQGAVSALAADGYPVVAETLGSNTAFDGDTAVFEVLMWDRPQRLVDARSAWWMPAARYSSPTDQPICYSPLTRCPPIRLPAFWNSTSK
jgi:hypothetical protein